MNTKRLLLSIIAGLLLASSPAFAADDGIGAKFSRGIANLVTGWVEVPKNIANESRRHNAAVGLTWGVVKGAVHTVGRTTMGGIDTATFFVPSRSLVHADYVWDDFDRDTTYGAQ